MGLLVYLIVLAVSGLIVGGLARLALPGPDPMSIWMTILIGLAGSFIGGLVMLAITGGRNAGGIVVSVAAATLIVYLIRRRRGGSITDPGLGPAAVVAVVRGCARLRPLTGPRAGASRAFVSPSRTARKAEQDARAPRRPSGTLHATTDVLA